MELTEKLELESEKSNAGNDINTRLAYKYGYVVNGLQYRINELEKSIKELKLK